MLIDLFIPCFIDQFYPQTGMNMVKILEKLGVEVHYNRNQTCCGQMAFNSGFWDEARPVAERFVRIFRQAEVVVCPSGSCTAMVRCFYPELLKTSALRADALALGTRVFEFSEFLVDVARVTDVGAHFPHTVTYHDSCHLLRELHVKRQPRELLKKVSGLRLVELEHSEECCGFGGVFAVKFPAISGAMGEVKADLIEATGAEFVTACDPSCLMHIEGKLRRQGAQARTIHLASILAATASAGVDKPATTTTTGVAR